MIGFYRGDSAVFSDWSHRTLNSLATRVLRKAGGPNRSGPDNATSCHRGAVTIVDQLYNIRAIPMNPLPIMKRRLSNLRRRAANAYLRRVDPVVHAWRGRPQPLHPVVVSSESEYREYAARLQSSQAYESRHRAELALPHRDGSPFLTRGYCYACGVWTLFHSSWAYAAIKGDGTTEVNFREHLVCPHCGLNNRMRASLHLLMEMAQPLPTSQIYATEQATSLYRNLLERFPQLTGSEFLGANVARGAANAQGIRNEDLTRLSFRDEQFDVVLSFEVLEHIPDYRAAIAECARILRSGGKMLFSVPFDLNAERNLVRARLGPEGTVEHLLPPEYHGDPLNSCGCLCYRHFGWELLTEVKHAGFSIVSAILYYSRDLGYLGYGQVQFLAVK